MSDRIDELVASADPHMKWLCQRLNVQGTGYEGGPDDRALREVKKAMSQLATIAREAEAMVDWLVQYAADCGECPRTRYDENEDGCRECLDSIRRSAHKAVSK